MRIELGPLAPPLKSQLLEYGIPDAPLLRLQRAADSIDFLVLENFISASEATILRGKVSKDIGYLILKYS